MKTAIKLSIVILIVILFIFRVYTIHPNLEKSDLYEVSGVCTDVRTERSGFGRYSHRNRYIIMNNGKEYGISSKLWKYIGEDKSNLIGKHISFLATEKPLSWYVPQGIVAWNDNEEVREITLKMENNNNRLSRIVSSILFLLIGCCVMLPEGIDFVQKKYEIKIKKISEENRTIRRAKRQAKREYFNDPNNIPDMRNASRKKKKKR